MQDFVHQQYVMFVSQENRHVLIFLWTFSVQGVKTSIYMIFNKHIPLESKPDDKDLQHLLANHDVHIPDVLASTISCAALYLQSASILLWAASLLIAKAT